MATAVMAEGSRTRLRLGGGFGWLCAINSMSLSLSLAWIRSGGKRGKENETGIKHLISDKQTIHVAYGLHSEVQI